MSDTMDSAARRFWTWKPALYTPDQWKELGYNLSDKVNVVLASAYDTLLVEKQALEKQLAECESSNYGGQALVDTLREENQAVEKERDRLRAALIQAIYNRSPYTEDATGDPFADGLREYMTQMEVEALADAP